MMRVTAKADRGHKPTRTLANVALAEDLDQIGRSDDGSLYVRFLASGMDDETTTYRYAIRLSPDDIQAIISARYVKPLLERIEELENQEDAT